MKNNGKQAKFFCESCGSEVPANSKICLTCGKFFAAVRCPNCGATGNNSDFINGCPECGYAVDGSTKSMKNIKSANNKRNIPKKSGKSYNKKSSSLSISTSYSESSLPVWIYVTVTSILLILVLCLYKCMI